jgi:hypothetical protein
MHGPPFRSSPPRVPPLKLSCPCPPKHALWLPRPPPSRGATSLSRPLVAASPHATCGAVVVRAPGAPNKSSTTWRRWRWRLRRCRRCLLEGPSLVAVVAVVVVDRVGRVVSHRGLEGVLWAGSGLHPGMGQLVPVPWGPRGGAVGWSVVGRPCTLSRVGPVDPLLAGV